MAGCEEWLECFQIYDPESAGAISTKDAAEATRALGCNPSEWEVQDLIAGISGSTTVTYGDFCSLMGQLDSGGANSDDLIGAFKQFDRDASGTLPGNELRYILTNMGEVMTDQECNEMMRQAGFKDDTMINYSEFVGKILAGVDVPSAGRQGKKKGIKKGADRRSIRFGAK